MKSQGPHRPVGPFTRVVRRLVRQLRYYKLRLTTGAELTLGRNVVFGSGCRLLAPNFVRFGDNVSIGREFHVEQNLIVGNDVLISSNVSIVGNDHPFDDPTTTVFFASRAPAATVVMEGDNLIGFGTTIVGSVTLGRGCIVGARSLVTRSLPPNTVCVGSPAKVVRHRYSRDSDSA